MSIQGNYTWDSYGNECRVYRMSSGQFKAQAELKFDHKCISTSM